MILSLKVPRVLHECRRFALRTLRNNAKQSG